MFKTTLWTHPCASIYAHNQTKTKSQHFPFLQADLHWIKNFLTSYQSTAHVAVIILCTHDVEMFLHFQTFLQADSGAGSFPTPLFTNLKNPTEPPIVKITDPNSIAKRFGPRGEDFKSHKCLPLSLHKVSTDIYRRDGGGCAAGDRGPDKHTTAGLLVCDDPDSHVNTLESPRSAQVTRRSVRVVKRTAWRLLSTERRRGRVWWMISRWHALNVEWFLSFFFLLPLPIIIP